MVSSTFFFVGQGRSGLVRTRVTSERLTSSTPEERRRLVGQSERPTSSTAGNAYDWSDVRAETLAPIEIQL